MSQRRLRVVLMPVGSHGDVHPFIAVGKAMRRRGHRVEAYASGHFDALFRDAGIPMTDYFPADRFRTLIEHPDAWRPGVPSMRFVVRHCMEIAPRQIELMEALRGEPDLLVVAGALAFGVRVAQDRDSLPVVTLQLSPAAIPSVERPPVYPGMLHGDWVPPWLGRLQARLGLWIGGRLFGELQALRRELALAPVADPIRWMCSPLLTVGLFPEWLCPPPPDWPPSVRLTGFPLYDEADVTPVPPQAEAFLAGCEAAGGPVVFTPGSAMTQGRRFFEAAADACRRLGRPGVLLTRHPEQVPSSLPEDVRHFDYLPLSKVLPRAAAMVHHGGIGTLAQTLAAGVPHLVMPMAHDQFDNARRLERLGVGRGLPASRFTGARVARAIDELAGSDTVRGACRDAARRLEGIDAVAETCDLLEAAVSS